MIAGACFTGGLMSFEFISYHFAKAGIVTEHWIPIFLTLSTGFGVIASLVTQDTLLIQFAGLF